ncbi:uncharacterized protein LY89DRAFT_552096, partial [Mollisia scopiformis]
ASAALLTYIAVTFARCRTRSPRDVLRNVTRCLQLLRRHRRTLSPKVSRSVTRAGISHSIELDKIVPAERAAWAVRTIRSVEGPEVADTVAMIVANWNE